MYPDIDAQIKLLLVKKYITSKLEASCVAEFSLTAMTTTTMPSAGPIQHKHLPSDGKEGAKAHHDGGIDVSV